MLAQLSVGLTPTICHSPYEMSGYRTLPGLAARQNKQLKRQRELSQSLQGIDISATTTWRVLRTAGFRKTKPTRKPGLTKKMRAERLKWCLDHQHWTLEDWKNVIWSDETSVVLNHRRGGYRIWRKADEAFLRSCIRERWKGYSEFMFWGCFTYNKKGPCHCWIPETKNKKERDATEVEIHGMNEELEPILREEWELSNGIRRMSLCNLPSIKPLWRWNKKNGKLSREKQGGEIDWYRYQKKILIPKMFPFARECMVDRPDTICTRRQRSITQSLHSAASISIT
ncbi:hypothetical protein VC83_09662 [Pseudogymnoascus destructans]|uniref:Transposase Tc1-like domain-containing protein n=1 Tax=Pseudogymnoascus destructans TaxID=655981 RepID=A0A2P6FGM5_9PEZI|nr:uncharacterized protein VC83_09662 [Pseudogymnoascus destructans]PQM43535.1 hypothetical protein VC83_09662 [Pseudogymnoascus destructans]